MKNTSHQQLIELIRRAVKPALGCTEPISAAYAAAVAMQAFDSRTPDRLDVYVSGNLYKNAMGVFVPGTGRTGLHIASATGALAGKAEKGLEVLADITAGDVEKAQRLIDEDRIFVHQAQTDEFIYCSVTATCNDIESSVTICGSHTNIVSQSVNGVATFIAESDTKAENSLSPGDIGIDIKTIYTFATAVNYDDIRFILDAATLNTSLAEEGMKNHYGLAVGKTIQENIQSGILSDDLNNRVQMYAAAASDARMGGATLPAMSNYGSGNQGIAATMPVTVVAHHFGADDEQLARALVMSHLSAIYIKSHYPPLSAFCGNTVTSAAAAMAMVYLSGGSFEQCCYAIQNVLSDSSGMVCDGAKSSCALKVCTASGVAVRAFLMAIQDKVVTGQGIVAHDIEQTIRNVGQLVSHGMADTDVTILEIMSA
ncbi:Serine dehydratase alpha chain [Vibrio aerogenes CECT 7868]|uniref:UPF0597 protein VA7868_04251 n=1 Tax=Vibrio aerogenes CECT 7868 TaxID=1216006 RepID=A0A1M6DK99_9VIBR|nr:L-serine ammonia-lyase, iron-sulfur-dependent, subunit alpha [Vibrio aerogenes]SHI73469.1 Serine dehydratase alpha chain [Vibrio aerogenes CECT 7868]